MPARTDAVVRRRIAQPDALASIGVAQPQTRDAVGLARSYRALAVEEAHAAHEQVEQEERDGARDEARPEVLVVADRLAGRVEDRRRRRDRARRR